MIRIARVEPVLRTIEIQPRRTALPREAARKPSAAPAPAIPTLPKARR